MRTLAVSLLSAAVVLLGHTAASAQTLGSFAWQLQPFCNAVTIVVTQNGAVYTLDGFDDQCGGASPRAPLVGTATGNPDGSIGFGFSIVTSPGGAPVHVRATIAVPSLSGTWSDSAGNSGAFVLGGAAAGTPRPMSAGLSAGALTVTGAGSVAGAFTAASVATGALAAASVSTTGAGTFDSLNVTNIATVGSNVNAGNILSRTGFMQASLFNNSPSSAPVLQFSRGRGTASSPLPPLSGDRLGTMTYQGVTNPAGGFRSGASIQATTTEGWSFAGSGANLTFSTNPNGSNATVQRMIIDHNGEVGIGTTTPDQLLTVNGNASKVGGGSWATFSDQRLKDVRGGFGRGMAELLKLEPIRYTYKVNNPLGLRGAGEYVGFSAQAVQAVIPEAVSTSASGYLQVNADPILWTMLNALKELKAENDDLRTRLAALEAGIKKP